MAAPLLTCLMMLSVAAPAGVSLELTVAARPDRDAARLAAHRQVRDALAAELAAARTKQTGRVSSNRELRESLEQTAAEIVRLREQLASATADLGDLMAAGRQAAGDLHALRQRESIVGGSTMMDNELSELASTSQPLSSSQLRRVWQLVVQQLDAVSGIRVEPGIDGVGGPLVQVGAFAAYDDARFYALRGGRATPLGASGELLPAPADTGFFWVIADAGRGASLAAQGALPDADANLAASGAIGMLITALGAAGVVVVLLRLPSLLLTRRRMQRHRVFESGPDNPLARLMQVAANDASGNALERALRREVTTLERGQPLLGLLVAMAPLLGLLGTVTGMIITFQTLGLYGGSDPTLMAGGISRALTTTALGLAVAVPLALALAAIRALSNACVQMLEEFAAAQPASP